MDTEDYMFDRRVLHQVGRNLERLRVFDDRLNSHTVIQPDQYGRKIAYLSRPIRFTRLGQHHNVNVIGEVADEQ